MRRQRIVRPMRRRLLAISAVDTPGGAEIHLERLVAGLAARGWEVALTSPSRGALAERAISAGHGWEPLPVGGLGRGQGFRAAMSWPRARSLASGFDVAYLNGTVPARLLPALVRMRARRVLHVHDMVTRVPRFWSLADVVLADSGAVAARLSGLQASVVYGPVDLDPPAVTSPWASGAPVVGFVGRIEPRKGPLDLVRAAPLIRAGEPGARVVIVGDDPYGADPSYTQSVLASEDVERLPWCAEAPGLMRHLDVLVLPSYEEPFGTVLAEAMAVGTPVVATRVDGLPEVVQDGVTGRLVAPGDPPGLAAAVLEVLSRRSEMGAAAAASASRFGVEAYVDRVERLLISA
jgi:glycosyltransferase involved in cell wall biosynthesis